MQYPDILLPKNGYSEIPVEIVEHHFLCRCTNKKEFINPSTGLIFDDELYHNPLDFFDYSTNHLGHFTINHNSLSLCGYNKPYFRKYWDWEEKVSIPKYEEDFIVDHSKGVFFLPIQEIHNKITFPYTKDNKDGELTAIVVHTPTNSNFWHFSIKWKDKSDAIISSNNSKWKNPIIASIRAIINEIMSTDPPKPNPIDLKLFT